MTRKSIWEKRWTAKTKDVRKSTSLDYFARRAFEILDREVKPEHKRILEVGSGTGRFCIALAEKYPDKDIVGIDYTKESIDLSKEGAKLRGLKNIRFEKADLFKLPYKTGEFDLVFENGVIEHFRNYPDALKEMKRVTKKGGTIAVFVNNWFCFPKTLEKKVLGKRYPFGYEKSFKHTELKSAFRDLTLKDVDVFAYAPANYIVRFFFFNQSLKKGMAIVTEAFERLFDFLTARRFSKTFGYMIFAKGKK